MRGVIAQLKVATIDINLIRSKNQMVDTYCIPAINVRFFCGIVIVLHLTAGISLHLIITERSSRHGCTQLC